MSRYIAAYDITDDSQRLRVARVLDRYGMRLQMSVFEVWLDPDELVDLRRQLGPLLGDSDTFEIIPIDQAPNRERWCWGGQTRDQFAAVVVLGR